MSFIEQGAEKIKNALSSAFLMKKGCLIGRNGTIEIQVLSGARGIESVLELHAGIFPPTETSVNAWREEYKRALLSIDEEPIVAGWYEPMAAIEYNILSVLCPLASRIPLRSLEPYYVDPALRWTSLLKGKRIAVISSFANTCVSQAAKAEEIWGPSWESLLPPATWIPIQTGYAPRLAAGRAEWNPPCKSWQVAMDRCVEQITEAGVDIALIGCGGIGMPLAGRLKELGLPCVVLGGAIQVLFGIMGNRWANHSVISKFWNDAWVWPSEEETPRGAAKIEGGCYWA
jgi:hypothetical protein